MSTESHPEFQGSEWDPPRSLASVAREMVRDAIIARARELAADPGYPTPAIIGEVVDLMERHGVIPGEDPPDG